MRPLVCETAVMPALLQRTACASAVLQAHEQGAHEQYHQDARAAGTIGLKVLADAHLQLAGAPYLPSLEGGGVVAAGPPSVIGASALITARLGNPLMRT